MSIGISLRLPSYRRHKPTGQAVVTLTGEDYYLGRWNTGGSRAVYDRLIGAWLVGATGGFRRSNSGWTGASSVCTGVSRRPP
jgi:hypothetical protein